MNSTCRCIFLSFFLTHCAGLMSPLMEARVSNPYSVLEEKERLRREFFPEAVKAPRNLSSVKAVEPKEREAAFKREGRRLKHRDFIDVGESEGSLWSFKGRDNYLFTPNKRVDLEDVVLVRVGGELREKMERALKKSLEKEKRKKRLASLGGNKNAVSIEDEKRNFKKEIGEFNLIRMRVVEDLGDNFLRLLGTKVFAYKEKKTVLRITALVRDQDIGEDYKVNSSSFLDQMAWAVK